MNIFENLQTLQDSYSSYVFTFQKFRNPVIKEWVHDRIKKGTLLWKEPFVQLNRRFKEGVSLVELIQEGVLHPKCKNIFVKDLKDENSETIQPYSHQSESISKVLKENQNVLITTGTGSGKSFCFGIPIISKCLELKQQGINGIKAIIVYPMNALANSQYDDFAERLHGSGVKIALYTGDTKNNPEEAIQNLRDSANREPYDSEVLSREEIQQNPPDILLTNYVMLDLILTRFEDRKLFPSNQKGVLQFLVFDEIHTYSGKRGADVACLIRRLKEWTDTTGNIKCIGTSATVQSREGEKAENLIAEFAENIFGEQFSPDNVIGESYIPLQANKVVDLPPISSLTEELIKQFDGSVSYTAKLIASFFNDSSIESVTDPLELGKKLLTHPAIGFFEEILLKRPLSITGLAKEYQETFRPKTKLNLCQLELQAILLVGTIAQVEISGSLEPIFIPKLHTFFSQGRTIMSCINVKGPHLNDRGEVTCSICSEESLTAMNYPLHFCRACGQEYYGVSELEDNTLIPREMDPEESENNHRYLFFPPQSEEELVFPEEWSTSGGVPRTKYQDRLYQTISYCSFCNKLDPSCSHLGKVTLYSIPYPFLYCPSCGVYYDRRPREFSKLFTFGTVGRSTGTDVLVSSMLEGLPINQRKVIAFSDSRQDTALQAAHINHLFKRVHFRRGLYQTLLNGEYTKKTNQFLPINKIGLEMFDTYKETHTLPNYTKGAKKYGRTDRVDGYFQQYLVYAALNDLAEPIQRNQMNLEDVGLLRVIYDGLDQLARDENVWKSIPEFSELTSDLRYDYLLGFLDIFRRQKMIYDEKLLNYNRFKKEVIEQLNEDALPDVRYFGDTPIGYSDAARNDRPKKARVLRLTTSQSRLVQWTKKVTGSEEDKCKELVLEIINILSIEEIGFLYPYKVKGIGILFMIPSDCLELMGLEGTEHKTCLKCGTIYHFQQLNLCTKKDCPELSSKPYNKNYFRMIYTTPLIEAVAIEAEEHSGQLEGDERRKIEMRFKDPDETLNVLVCTPTMELGIDIGALSAIYMRNVPPNPSNYAQRAGRAGRKNQPSIITTFCGVGFVRGPHDQYFYRFPGKIIAGKISPPRFSLNNEKLLKAHIHSITIESIDAKIPGKANQLLDLSDLSSTNNLFPIFNDRRMELDQKIQQESQNILDSVKNVFQAEMISIPWFTEEWIRLTISSFVHDLNQAFDYWRREYISLLKEHQYISRLLEKQRPDSDLYNRDRAITAKLDNMREGKQHFYVFRYLGMQGFLPNYGFPSSNAYLSFYDRDDEIARDSTIALSEFAPGNLIYLRGNRYRIRFARPKKEVQNLVFQDILICPKCSLVFFRHDALTAGACPECETSFEGIHPHPHCMVLPDMFAIRSRRITSDEEERLRVGSNISHHYEKGDTVQSFSILSKNNTYDLKLTYDHDANIFLINKGTRGSEEGFTICNACNRWIFGEKNIVKHVDPDHYEYCNKHATSEDIIRGIYLFTRNKHDVVIFDLELPPDFEPEQAENFYQTLKETVLRALEISLDLSDDELDAFLLPNPDDETIFRIILYEKAEGGVGILQGLLNENRFRDMVSKALELIHETDPEDACQRACYECLLSFHNQRVHHLLNRNLVVPLLRGLTSATISGETTEKFTIDDDSLLDKCESELERRVLLKIKELELRLPNEVQKTIYQRDRPVARVDFFYEPNICLFVDGPVHEKDYVLEDDVRKRRELKGLGYRIFSVKDPNGVENLGNILK